MGLGCRTAVFLAWLLALLLGLGRTEAGEELYIARAHKKLAFLPEFGGLAVPNRTDSLSWLRRYFATDFVSGNQTASSQDVEWGEIPSARQRWATGATPSAIDRDSRDTLLRRFLVVALVGDTWSPNKWFVHRGRQDFSLAVIYIGQNPHSFQCRECSHVWRMQGLKWQLIQRLSASPSWNALAAQYHYVMFADDDLIMQAEDLNTVFHVMAQYKLLLAQPSLCPGSSSWVVQLLTQQPENLLRYTTFVEIMAPTFDMGFFTNVVRHTFFEGITGYGFELDHLWPALLRYSRRGVAVIDAVCMLHPSKDPSQASIYRVPSPLPPPLREQHIINDLFRLPEFKAKYNSQPRELSAVRLKGTVKERHLQEVQQQHTLRGGWQAGLGSVSARRRPDCWVAGLMNSVLLAVMGSACLLILWSMARTGGRRGPLRAA